MTHSPKKKTVSPPSCVAQIGLGYWGQNILKTLVSLNLSRIVVFDQDAARLQNATSLSPNIECASSLQSILKDPAIEAVCIASPVEWHARHVLAALRAGKHVFVEKPLSRTVKEAETIATAARISKRHVMVGHIYIHHPAIVELKRWIHHGKMGRIYWVRSSRCSLGPRVRDDVDVLWDYAIHDVYLAPYLLDKKVSRVRADGRSHLKSPRADWVEFSMEFEGNGVVMHGFVSWLNPAKERSIMIVGSKGIAVFDELKRPCLAFYRCGYKPFSGMDSWGNRNLRLFDNGKEEYDCETNQTLRIELRHFLDHLNTPPPPRATLTDGLTTLRLLEKLGCSLRRNGVWIPTT